MLVAVACDQLELDTQMHEPPTDTAVVNAIARVTGGNFRLVNRLLAEIERVLAVNGLSTVRGRHVITSADDVCLRGGG